MRRNVPALVAHPHSVEEAPGAFRELTRHFFTQFIHGDSGGDDPLAMNFAGIVGLLVGPALMYVFFDMPRYVTFAYHPIHVQIRESLPDKFFLIAVGMVAMGLLMVFKWDAMFPERSDYVILLPLPLRYRTIFLAKLTALAGFMGMFLLAVNAISLLIFPMISTRRGIAGFPQTFAANAIALLSGSIFVVLLVVSVHGVLLNVLPFRSVQRVGPYLQSALLVTLLALFFFSLQSSQSLLHFKDENSLILYFMPPFWFTGLYDRLLGVADPAEIELSRIALHWLAAVFVISVVSYAINYRRHLRRVMESQPDAGSALAWTSRVSKRFADRVLVRTSRQQAVYWFALRTILRSRRHRLLLAIYTAAGVALVAEGGVALIGGLTNFRQDVSMTLLCFPIMVTFFVVAAVRHGFILPFELQSSWIFRLAQAPDSYEIATAIRRAAMTLTVFPLCTVSAIAYFAFFRWTYALYCTAMAILVTSLIVELFFLNWHGVPFTNPRREGHPAAAVLALMAWMIATWFAYGISNLEQLAQIRPLARILSLAILTCCLAIAIACRRQSRVHEEQHVEYESTGEKPFLLLDLSS